MKINENESLIPARGPKIARALVAKAESLGIDPQVIRTYRDGYIVPTELAESLEASDAAEDIAIGGPEAWAPESPANEGKQPKPSKRSQKPAGEFADEAGNKAPKVEKPAEADADEKAKAAKAEQDRLDAEQAAEDKRIADEAAAKKQAEDDEAAKQKQAEADEAAKQKAAEENPELVEPSKGGSRADWEAFAKAKVAAVGGTWDDADDDLGRNELVEKFGTPDPAAE